MAATAVDGKSGCPAPRYDTTGVASTAAFESAFGDELATFSTFHGTHRGEFRGVSPTGNAVRVSSSCHTRFQDGKVVEETVLFDQEGMLSQLRQR